MKDNKFIREKKFFMDLFEKKGLTSQQSRAVYGRLCGLSYSKIGEIMDVSENTAKNHGWKGLKVLNLSSNRLFWWGFRVLEGRKK